MHFKLDVAMAPVTLLVVRNVVFSLLETKITKFVNKYSTCHYIFCFDYAILSSSAIEYQMYMETQPR